MTREEMIIEFYENGKVPVIIAIYDLWKKEKTNGIKHISKLVENRFNKLFTNGKCTIRNNKLNQKNDNEGIKNE